MKLTAGLKGISLLKIGSHFLDDPFGLLEIVVTIQIQTITYAYGSYSWSYVSYEIGHELLELSPALHLGNL